MDYHVATIGPDRLVRWQPWFRRSWSQLIRGTILSTIGLIMLHYGFFFIQSTIGNNFSFGLFTDYGVSLIVSLLIGLMFGLLVTICTTWMLDRQIGSYQLWWFSLHYVGWSALVVLGFRWLSASSFLWEPDPDRIYFYYQTLWVYLPLSSFIVASGLVAWRMQRWLKQAESLASAPVFVELSSVTSDNSR